MASAAGGSSYAPSAAERVTTNGSAKLALRGRIPSINNKWEKVEAKYNVVLDYPNLELHSAAASGNLGLVHYALTHGQPVNSLLYGCLPLHAACSGGSVSVVRMLIDCGADVNAPRLPRRYSDNGKRGINAPSVGTVGSTPLHFAAANGHIAVVQILLGCGAIATTPDKNGLSPEDLAEMSGYTEIVHAIRVWSHVNERPGTSMSVMSDPDASLGLHRADVGPSITTGTASETDVPVSAKGKDRATSMVSVTSEKARLFRTSLENGLLGGRGNSASSDNGTSMARTTSCPYDDSTTPSGRPEPSLVPTPTVDVENDSSNLRSPFAISPTSERALDDEWSVLANGSDPVNGLVKAPVLDQESPSIAPPSPSSAYNSQRSSRRPSLPSIFERAAHPGAAFRTAMRKTGNDSSPSITESDQAPSHDSATSMFVRGRNRASETIQRTKSQKRTMLKLFRRGQLPHSRSPSPPKCQELTVPRPAPKEQLTESIARLKRASMDPEMMQMATDVLRLGDQLEAAASISAPVTKTHFFDDLPKSPSSQSVSSDRPAPKMPPPPTIERARDPHRGRNGTCGVLSPSPLVNTWGNDGDDEPRRAPMRRSVTQVVRKPVPRDPPRRMPSLPAMAGQDAAKRLSRVLVNGVSPPTDASGHLGGPSSDSGSLPESEEFVDATTTPPTEPSPSQEKPNLGDEGGQGDATIKAPSTGLNDPTSLSVKEAENGVDVSSVVANPRPAEHTFPFPEARSNLGPFGGDSMTPLLTHSLAGRPSSRILTLPGSTGNRVHPDTDLRSLGFLPGAPEGQPTRASSIKRTSSTKLAIMSNLGSGLPSERAGPSSLPSERLLASTIPERGPPLQRSASQKSSPAPTSPRKVHRSTSLRSSSQRSTLDGPIPEGRPLSLPQRSISSHAEARDAMEQDERDVLSIAQLPHSEMSSRTLADQLAAYGDSHALAEEFARVERLSTVSSASERRSSQRYSTLSSGSTASRNGTEVTRRSSASFIPRVPPHIDSSVSHIYDRRETAYRDRMAVLTATTAMRGFHQRTMSGTPRSRATSTSDMWLTAGPSNTALHTRRLTDPTGSSPKELDSNPHISGPLPMVSDFSRSGQNSLSPRTSPLTMIKAGVSSSTLPRNSPNSSSLPAVPRRNGHPSRMTSHSVDSTPRYPGLAQARAYAAQSSQSSSVKSLSITEPRKPRPPSDTGEDEDEDELEPEPSFGLGDVSQWQHGLPKPGSRWDQLKGHMRPSKVGSGHFNGAVGNAVGAVGGRIRGAAGHAVGQLRR
ncbi:hypothetical protein CspeluHIS016_0405850 [Cutaneotrichosporon spelunceum]|uniref:Ankyrin n=1 Tax=Cutaneotrichosporon spelunceum TaxID=1672016 RepID=A0AAD3TWA2_9TREE|nr:hypothetical protein CspeluHIS016_0405850 [Cutaneotrichosporon spelunceum]